MKPIIFNCLTIKLLIQNLKKRKKEPQKVCSQLRGLQSTSVYQWLKSPPDSAAGFHTGFHAGFSSHDSAVVSHRALKAECICVCLQVPLPPDSCLYPPFYHIVCHPHLLLKWRSGQNAQKINMAVLPGPGNRCLPHGWAAWETHVYKIVY